jgi:hypothetical protein
MSAGTIFNRIHNMIAAPAANADFVQVMFRSEDGIMSCYSTLATNDAILTAANTYAPGCSYTKVVAGGSSILYLNTGTYATPTWTDQK